MESGEAEARGDAEEGASVPGLHRVRVWIRGEGGERIPMVGLVGPQGLERLRELQAALAEAASPSLAVATRLKQLEPVFLRREGAAPVPARRLLLGMRMAERSLQRGQAGPVVMCEELRGFVTEADWLRQSRAWVGAQVPEPVEAEATAQAPT